MHLGYNNPKADYVMDGSVLQSVGEEKDLRVIVSDDFKWEKQCCEAVKRLIDYYNDKKKFYRQITGYINSLVLYKGLVRPHLEYCCSVWNPHFRKDIELIEGVQRRATKLVKDVEHLHRLEHVGLMCLHTRRTRSDLIDTYKIINGIYNVKTERGHSKKLFKRRSRLDIRKFAFSNRIVDRWNSLSECCVTCNSINCFKSHISIKLEPETT